MLIMLFELGGIIHSEFLLQVLKINQQIYMNILGHMFYLEHEKRRELWKDKS